MIVESNDDCHVVTLQLWPAAASNTPTVSSNWEPSRRNSGAVTQTYMLLDCQWALDEYCVWVQSHALKLVGMQGGGGGYLSLPCKLLRRLALGILNCWAAASLEQQLGHIGVATLSSVVQSGVPGSKRPSVKKVQVRLAGQDVLQSHQALLVRCKFEHLMFAARSRGQCVSSKIASSSWCCACLR